MSTNYTDTLKRIKEAEEDSNREVSEKKKGLEAELHEMEQAADQSIEVAKRDAEIYVTKEVVTQRNLSQKEAEALLASATRSAEAIVSKRLERKEFRKLIDETLFSEFKSE
jgi:vacuolar-type H+-ATPase subunit H